ncbi:diguanylate cyclase domain-containing protein [Piscinibacter sp.]|uniref:diguanylate cyclase domain-containing protein n=1 Tax=Piscinibacter sp. TaxID=1903157 RepID=UPI002CF24FC5|nr:diguanylate cyclase [Albitalea sp.]HUG24143.1 diguanylate cyclase [Albitalea sp.]
MDDAPDTARTAPSPVPDEQAVRTAEQRLARLNAQAAGVRAELMRLRHDLAQVQQDFNGLRAAQLVEANEQLVLAALHAQAVADTAVSNLDELARSAQRDTLTGTPDRALMLDRLDTAIAQARRRGTHIGVLFVDLDQFKQINDSLGHAVGDAVLQLVARRLELVVRDTDTVSRHGGDEFLVLLPELAQPADAALIAEKILAALAEPAPVADHVLHLSASVGIAVYPEDGIDSHTLITRADAAMYRSKRRGPGGWEFRGTGVPSIGPVPPPAKRREADPQQGLHLRNLREVNEQLVIAAMTSHELEAQVEEVHTRQIKFLAMVAHELRNPLAPIRTAAELLKRARADDPVLARLQVVIERQVAHMSRLVEDLLDGSRVSTGKFRLECSHVDMADIVALAVETCRPLIDRRHQQLTVQQPGGTLPVYGDPVRLAQVLGNLLDNASKYTPERGQITLTATVEGGAIVITVSDNGIGITREALRDVFDLFVQGTRALTAHNRGLGIGLAVVRELVEAHGGTVAAKSAGRDLGSEFTVTLPLAAASPEQ